MAPIVKKISLVAALRRWWQLRVVACPAQELRSISPCPGQSTCGCVWCRGRSAMGTRPQVCVAKCLFISKWKNTAEFASGVLQAPEEHRSAPWAGIPSPQLDWCLWPQRSLLPWLFQARICRPALFLDAPAVCSKGHAITMVFSGLLGFSCEDHLAFKPCRKKNYAFRLKKSHLYFMIQ